MIYLATKRPLEHLSYQRIDLQDIKLKKITCLDLETTGLQFNRSKILLLIIGNKETQYVIDWVSYTSQEIKNLLSQSSLFIGHNLSFDLKFLIFNGIDFKLDSVYDTMETELSLTKGTGFSVSLKNTTLRRLGLDVYDKGITKEFTLMDYKDPMFLDRHIEYASEDIKHLEDIREKQTKEITRLGQTELMESNNKMVVVASYMTVRGIELDKKAWLKVYEDNLKKIDKLKLDMDRELAGLGLIQRKERKIGRAVQLDILGGSTDATNKNTENINYSSPAQIQSIFYHFKQPLPKKQDDTSTTGTAELEEYIKERPKSILVPFIKLLLQYRVVSKQISTYGLSFVEEHLALDGRVHSEFKINRTDTGRLSSNNPNMQNIPRLDRYRSCFKAREGYKLWTCDYSSAELRILADLSRDENMIKWYREGEDLHSLLATPVYNYLNGTNITITKKSHPEFRNQQKTVNFGIAYGASGYKISKVMNITKGQGEKVLEVMESMIPNAFAFLRDLQAKGQLTGRIKFEPRWNQIRYFYDICTGQKVSQKRLASVGRESMNAPFQGINGQMTKLAMISLFEYISKNKLKSGLVNTVHDEVVVEVAEDELSHIKNFRKIMLGSANYFLNYVEMEVEDSISDVWSK